MGSEDLAFFTAEWALAAQEAVNEGPSEEVKAEKLEKYWHWIEEAKLNVNCRLALAVRDLPQGDSNCLLLDLEKGAVTQARVVPRAEAEATATYLLAGDYADWQEIMSGYNMSKAIMYRKLLLEKGQVLEFFRAAYYWTESLACLQRIPTRF